MSEQRKRALEQRLALDPKDKAAALELGALYERHAWTIEGRPLTEWRRRLSNPVAIPALAALNRLGPAAVAATPELAACAYQHEDEVMRGLATRLLRKISDERAAPILLEGAGQDRPDWRASAIEALGELDPEAGRAAIIAALDDAQSGVRSAAAWACGALSPPLSAAELAPLSRALEDPELPVRRGAFRSLTVLRPPGFGALLAPRLSLEQTGGIDRQFFEALAAHPEVEGLQALFRRARDLPVAIFLYSILDLGEPGLQQLGEALRESTPGGQLVSCLALGTRAEDAVVPLLADALESSGAAALRGAAALALGGFSDPRAAEALKAARDDSEPLVRACVRLARE